jgi:AcrR family transcriptional regulator
MALPSKSEQPKTRRPFPLIFGAAGKRHDILDSAFLEFLESTYFGTDTNKIARRAGTALATLYHHFDDKLDIFLAVYDAWSQYELTRFKELTVGLGKNNTPAEIASAMTKWLIKSRRNARNFRASLSVLLRTESRIVEAYALRQAEVVEYIQNLLLSKGRNRSPTEIEADIAVVNAMVIALTEGAGVSTEASALIEAQISKRITSILELTPSA